MKRRTFLQGCALAGLCSVPAGCHHPKTRQEVLAAIALEVATPDVQRVLQTSASLLESIVRFADTPTVPNLESARDAWRVTALAWKSAACFRIGPLIDGSAFLRAAFWPASALAIEPVLAGQGAINDLAIADLGVNARGIYALEYLLFPLDADDATTVQRFQADAGSRHRLLAVGLARSVVQYATKANQVLGDGEAFARQFADGGQQSLGKVVEQMIATVESLMMHRLELVLRLDQNQTLHPADVEGWPSGTSKDLILTQLSTSQRLYTGGKHGGISDLVSAVSAEIAARLAQKYVQAITAVRALNAPLEQVVRSNRSALTFAAASTKALEAAMKTDLTSALGINLTFQSFDGD